VLGGSRAGSSERSKEANFVFVSGHFWAGDKRKRPPKQVILRGGRLTHIKNFGRDGEKVSRGFGMLGKVSGKKKEKNPQKNKKTKPPPKHPLPKAEGEKESMVRIPPI